MIEAKTSRKISVQKSQSRDLLVKQLKFGLMMKRDEKQKLKDRAMPNTSSLKLFATR